MTEPWAEPREPTPEWDHVLPPEVVGRLTERLELLAKIDALQEEVNAWRDCAKEEARRAAKAMLESAELRRTLDAQRRVLTDPA